MGSRLKSLLIIVLVDRLEDTRSNQLGGGCRLIVESVGRERKDLFSFLCVVLLLLSPAESAKQAINKSHINLKWISRVLAYQTVCISYSV